MQDKLAQHEAQEEQKARDAAKAANQQNKGHQEEADAEEDDPDFRDDGAGQEIMRKMLEERVRDVQHAKKASEKRSTQGIGSFSANLGEYIEVDEEKFFLYTTRDKYVVCHFFHSDFKRCKIVDGHLSQIAYSHPECKFISVNVEKAPFLTKKLQIQTLPTIICFIEGKTVDKIIGFEELGGTDEFKTPVLTRRLAQSKVVVLKEDEEFKMVNKKKKNVIRGEESSDEDK